MLDNHASRNKVWTQLQHPFAHDVSTFHYTNPALPPTSAGVERNSAADALDYLFAMMYPRTQASVANVAALPAVGNNINDFRVVLDDGDGKYAGYTWLQLEGDGAPSWHKTHDPDFGVDDILTQLLDKTQNFYVFKYGFNDLDSTGTEIAGSYAGKRIWGGSGNNYNLTLSACDGTGGYIQLDDNLRPVPGKTVNIGTGTELVQHLYLSGNLDDGTNQVTVANAKTAYDHSQIITGNPHVVSYEDLTTQVGTLTLSGDASGSADLSTSGAKSLVVTVADNSHNHDALSTVNNLNAAVYGVLKATILQSGEGIGWTFTDVGTLITPTFTTTTAKITDVASPAADRILAANDAGDAWSAVTGGITLTGHVTGSGTYSDATGGWSFATTLAGGNLNSLSDVDTSANLDIGDYLIWNGTNWVPTSTGNKIDHALLDNLTTNDDHTQYALLAGRAGGQSLTGGTAASEALVLESTAHATKGIIQVNSSLAPLTDHNPPAETGGQDIGGSSANFKDLYMKGVFKGARFESVGATPGTNANTIGRVVFNTTDNRLEVCSNTGVFLPVGAGGGKYYDLAFDGIVITKSQDVSANIGDARKTICTLRDASDNYKQLDVLITSPDAATVQIDTTAPLPAGTYRLIVVEVE